jgi:hypothetical protein
LDRDQTEKEPKTLAVWHTQTHKHTHTTHTTHTLTLDFMFDFVLLWPYIHVLSPEPNLFFKGNRPSSLPFCISHVHETAPVNFRSVATVGEPDKIRRLIVSTRIRPNLEHKYI